MDTIGGIPAHPLFVHAPAVLIPLAALGVLIMVARPAWWDRYRWATLAVSGLGALGAMLAAESGEALEEGVEGTASRSQLHAHTEAGEAARTVAIVFFLVVLAATVVIPWAMRRRAASAVGDRHHAHIGLERRRQPKSVSAPVTIPIAVAHTTAPPMRFTAPSGQIQPLRPNNSITPTIVDGTSMTTSVRRTCSSPPSGPMRRDDI